ncbi:MAG: hypothetical protein JXR68_14270 [Bacteroidales bacterium]|nr:hypothetical protein [Bacteroidales bacterium]
MKKLIKFLVFLFQTFNLRLKQETAIKKLENSIAKREKLVKRLKSDFEIRTDILKVKKGNRRFYLFCFLTSAGKIKINIGRHKADNQNLSFNILT